MRKVADNTVVQDKEITGLDMDETIRLIEEPESSGTLPRRAVLWG
jgi:hypothetical protein